MNITIVEGNLRDQDVDVIVNAWNRNIIPWWLLLPQGVYRPRTDNLETWTRDLFQYWSYTNILDEGSTSSAGV